MGLCMIFVSFLVVEVNAQQCTGSAEVTIDWQSFVNLGKECSAEGFLKMKIYYVNNQRNNAWKNVITPDWAFKVDRDISTFPDCHVPLSIPANPNPTVISGVCKDRPISIEVELFEKDGRSRLASVSQVVLRPEVWNNISYLQYKAFGTSEICKQKNVNRDYCDQEFEITYAISVRNQW
jgi:hypothetical protein